MARTRSRAMKRLYEPLYKLMATFRIPKTLVFGSAIPVLSRVIDGKQIQPGRAIDVGCGVGAESIFLARQGFDVTGVDLSETAIKLAQRQASAAEVDVNFVVDDLTRIQHVEGTFDLLVDIGTLNDLPGPDRDLYVDNVVPLARSGSLLVLFGFGRQLPMNERVERLGRTFHIETLEDTTERVFRRRMITSLLTKK